MENMQFFWLAFTHRQPPILAMKAQVANAQESFNHNQEKCVF